MRIELLAALLHVSDIQIPFHFAGRGPNEGVTSERRVRRHGRVCDCDWLVGFLNWADSG
jgi:hypothetical protein